MMAGRTIGRTNMERRSQPRSGCKSTQLQFKSCSKIPKQKEERQHRSKQLEGETVGRYYTWKEGGRLGGEVSEPIALVMEDISKTSHMASQPVCSCDGRHQQD